MMLRMTTAAPTAPETPRVEIDVDALEAAFAAPAARPAWDVPEAPRDRWGAADLVVAAGFATLVVGLGVLVALSASA